MSIEINALNKDKLLKMISTHFAGNDQENPKKEVKIDVKKEIINEERAQNLKKNVERYDKITEEIRKVAEESKLLNRKIQLSVNEELNRVVITVVEKNSNRIIREIPSEELQNLAKHLKDAIGVLFDKTA